MRVAIVAESFLPNINGVTNSVLHVCDYLVEHGHRVIVIAPGARRHQPEAQFYRGIPLYRVPTVMVPKITSLPIGVPCPLLLRRLREFRPHVVHLASPFVLGAAGAFAARRLGIPAVAIYQTDVPGFATRYGLGALVSASWKWTAAFHNVCALTLAPSTPVRRALLDHGIAPVELWGRGVDAQLFRPGRRRAQLRARWDPTGTKHIVGYVGRLAPEKCVERLRPVTLSPDLQLVIVGDGVAAPQLRDALPGAVFTGELRGGDLAAAYASCDIFVQPGEFETFCQTIQEAQACGLPVVAAAAGGPRDLVDHGRTGLLLPPEHFEKGLRDALRWCLDPSRRAELSRNARDAVVPCTWTALCTQLMEHYQRVLTQARGQTQPCPTLNTRGQGNAGQEASRRSVHVRRRGKEL